MNLRRLVLPLLLTVATGAWACGTRTPTLDELPDELSCRRTVVVGPVAEAVEERRERQEQAAGSAPGASPAAEDAGGPELDELVVDWQMPPGSAEVAQLNPWCAAVGPAVVGGWADTAATPTADTLWLVTWNVHIGGGDLPGLVEDLRAGRLTRGAPVEHFVLLLQEVHREGELVPEHDPALPGGSGSYPRPPEGSRRDVVAAAEALGLWVVYVPSMRNGDDEDRGNALLSTVPLRSPVAVSLPMARQRRVAVSASATGRTSAGEPWQLQLTSVHLESSPAGWRSDEAQRLEQAEALLAALPAADAAVAAGDFNTKTRGRDEATVFAMLDAYPDTPEFPDTGPTYRKLFGLYREYLDYMFFRLPPSVGASYTRIPNLYGSDHFPLVGRVVW